MKKTIVVIAYKDMGVPERSVAFHMVSGWYKERGYNVVVQGAASRFSRAGAINAAIRRTDAQTIIQSDPDSLVPLQALVQAVQMALEDGLVVPHSTYLYTSQQTASEILDGRRKLWDVGPDECESVGQGVGNVTVFSRSTWEKAGGFDERFGVWGGDDAAFAYATAAVCQPVRRIEGPMVHLWHPRLPESEPGHPKYLAQFSILSEYRDAAAEGSEAVRLLLAKRGGFA